MSNLNRGMLDAGWKSILGFVSFIADLFCRLCDNIEPHDGHGSTRYDIFRLDSVSLRTVSQFEQ